MIKSTKALTASAFIAMFFLGVSASLIGATARSIGLTPFQIGLLIAGQNLGFILSVSISGYLSDIYEKPRILMVGSLILGFSFILFYATDPFWINFAIMFFIGVGTGTYEGVSDTMLLDIYPKRQNFYINVNHFFVTFGAIVIAVYLMFLQLNWRISTIQSGFLVLLLALFFGLAKLANTRARTEGYLEQLKILTRERTVVVLFILTALVIGVELGSIGIMTTFLTELRGFSQFTANVGLVIFLVGIATGRLVVGLFANERQLVQYILVLLTMSFVCFTTLFFLALNGLLIYINIFLAGVALSALTPLIITLGGLLYREIAGTVLGTIKMAMPVGGIAIAVLMSIIARQVSLQASLLVFPGTFLVALLILALEVRYTKSFQALST
jgi:MFS family permease